MVDRLSNLVSIFDSPSLDFGANRAEGDDLLGDAYKYLIRHFATESGKSKGQFYTPAEVSRVMAKIVGAGNAKSASQTIHDPTCGSGSLLLKAHDEAKSTAGLDLALYGQEMDNARTFDWVVTTRREANTHLARNGAGPRGRLFVSSEMNLKA